MESVIDKICANQPLDRSDRKTLTDSNPVATIDTIARHRSISPVEAAKFWTTLIVRLYESAEKPQTDPSLDSGFDRASEGAPTAEFEIEGEKLEVPIVSAQRLRSAGVL
jgi:hypothetical protein